VIICNYPRALALHVVAATWLSTYLLFQCIMQGVTKIAVQ